MRASAETAPLRALVKPGAEEPSIAAVVLIFWAAFAAVLVAMCILQPAFFEAQDPDSFLRIVQVRDLLAGQGWFDLVQHRMDPPHGALLQWSRMVDAPLAGLVLLGSALGLGETLAMTVWPVLLLLVLMSAAAALADTLGGRRAAIWSLILVLCFIDPLILYFPGDIDHHNAQVAVTLATVALAARLSAGIPFGILAGVAAAVSLAIGLEMLPYVAALSGIVALQWAWSGKGNRAVAAYGLTIAIASHIFYRLTGSPEAAFACDSLSYSFTMPIAIGGSGLALLALVPTITATRPIRLLGLAAIGAAALAWFLTFTPECSGGPYGLLSQEVRAAFLDTVSEAQPIWVYGAREPVGAVGSLGPLFIALVIAAWNLRGERRNLWLIPAVLTAVAVGLSFYQIRTLPFASALAVPIVACWLARIGEGSASQSRFRAALPVAVAFIVAIPLTWLLIGWGGEVALAKASGGRIAPIVSPKPDPALTKGMSEAQQNCFDPASATLLESVPNGLVLAPLFYGSTVLKLSGHSVIGAPYHRNGQAILDTIHGMHRPPEGAKRIVDARKADYVAICVASQESAIARAKAPDGLLAQLLAGRAPDWLDPIVGPEDSALRLWKVVR